MSAPKATPSARAAMEAYRPMFLAATLYGLVAVPAWGLVYAGYFSPRAGAMPALWHGHEMLFGYALAVVGGYLTTRAMRTGMAAAVIAWLAGRVAIVGVALPPGVEAVVLPAYPLVLFVLAGLPFLRAAKTPHNAVFAPLVGAFFVAELLYVCGRLGWLAQGEARGVALALGLVTILLFVMGGRVIAAATSGAHRRHLGVRLGNVAQARLEWAGIALIAAVALLETLRLWPGAAGAAALAAGAVAGVRLWRWRVWRLWRVAEVLLLHLGYGWLALGLVLEGAARLSGVPPFADAVHAVAVGALGTLTLVMMARVTQQRRREEVAFPGMVIAAAVLVSLAAGLRVLAAVPDWRLAMVGAAALCWTAAFALLAGFLVPRLWPGLRMVGRGAT